MGQLWEDSMNPILAGIAAAASLVAAVFYFGIGGEVHHVVIENGTSVEWTEVKFRHAPTDEWRTLYSGPVKPGGPLFAEFSGECRFEFRVVAIVGGAEAWLDIPVTDICRDRNPKFMEPQARA